MKSLLRLLAPVLALLGVSALAGCAAAYTPPTPTAASHTPTPTAELMRADILTAYRAGWAAIEDAEQTSDANDPALAAALVDPLLSSVRSHLATLKTQGIVDKGSRTLQPHVDSIASNSAVVVDCLYSENVEVYSSTGQPVPGQPGGTAPEYDAIHATVLLTPQGWKVSDQTATLGSCPAGY